MSASTLTTAHRRNPRQSTPAQDSSPALAAHTPQRCHETAAPLPTPGAAVSPFQSLLSTPKVYAPLDRKGLSLTQDKLADRFETRAPQLEDYNGLCELEASLPSSAFEVRVSKPKPAAVVGPAMRAEQRLRNTLDATAEALQRAKHAPDVEREEREVRA